MNGPNRTVAPCALCSEIGLAAKILFILLLVRYEVKIGVLARICRISSHLLLQ